jgi:RNA polymerase sigma-70 factor (ECF subfamily)
VDFEELYRATYPRVLAYTRSMASREDADDAVAETYAIAWRRQRDIPRGAELGWLIGVARRVLANARRSRRRAGALHALLDLQPRAPGPDPAERVEDGELRAALMALSSLTTGSQTTTREFWQSSDHPGSERERTEGAHAFETSGDALYDPATDTIYDPPASPEGADPRRAQAKVASPATGKPGEAVPGGDPMVAKVRSLLGAGRMVVNGPEVHNGTNAWAISLKPELGRPVWTLWVSAADGKPLELRDPGRDASEQPQVIRWAAYDVLPGSDPDKLLTLTGAHPSARVVHDAAQTAAAEQRLLP